MGKVSRYDRAILAPCIGVQGIQNLHLTWQWTSMLWSIHCQKRYISGPMSRAQMCNSLRWHAFFKVIRWPVIGLNWMQAQIQDFSQSKKLCLLVSIASPASFWFSEHDLSHTDVENYFQCSFIVFIVFNLRIALKRPYNKQLIYLLCSVITGKSQTSALMH